MIFVMENTVVYVESLTYLVSNDIAIIVMVILMIECPISLTAK